MTMQTKTKNQPIKDSYNRRIDYLRISITDKCNLKCVYCMPSKGLKYFKEAEILTDEEIVRFIRIARNHGLRKVRITGGEPLMRKNIISLVSSIKETGIRDLSLTTNGITLSKIAGDLKAAGLDRVNISLDTLEAARYKTITKGGDINLVRESIKEAERAGLTPVKINVVPIRGINEDEILAFASLTFKENYHIRFIEFMPATRNGIWRKKRCVNSEEVLEKISTLGKLESFEFRGRGPSRNYRLKGAAGIIGIISPLSDHFCGFCNRLRLTADGKIRPCLFSREEIDIKTPMRNNATDEDIDKLFQHSIKVKPRRHLLNENTASTRIIKTMSKIGG
ncbi:cyclic pyranopterin monophosphate synthase [bacterium BMS3Abin06]|nr:cyclic pyranopterin monophosphate synthase [bacterium BMS3Abin06]